MNARPLGLTLLGLLALSACGGTAAPSPAVSSAAGKPAAASAPAASRAPLNPSVTVRSGSTGSAAESALFLALDRGYFSDEGINFEYNRVKQGADAYNLDTGRQQDPVNFDKVIDRCFAEYALRQLGRV